MARENALQFAMNRGEVSRLALGRVDNDRVRVSAETMVNWLPKTLGPMTIRLGLGYLGATRSNLFARPAPPTRRSSN
jgi:hypothetical protein